MTGIGDRLREARQKKSLTVDQVQRRTHIHAPVIEALEEGRCEESLSPVYVKSYLKQYAAFLGLDAARIVEEYKATRPPQARTEPRQARHAPAEPSDEGAPAFDAFLPFVKLTALVAAVAVVVFFLGGAITSRFKRAKAPARTAGVARKAAAPAQARVSIPKNEPLKLLLKVNQPVLVKLKTDRNLLFSRVLPKGTAEEFTADKVIQIYVAKAEAIELILNGRNLGSPGRGIIEDLEITRTGLKVK